MPEAQKILSAVLEKITPTEAQRSEKRKITNKVLDAARAVLPAHVDVTLAGSYTRDTWLLDKREFDLFMLFPETFSRKDLETGGLEIGKNIIVKLGGTYEIAYAEHPYLRAKYSGFDIDIVPCYKVKSAAKIKSAVDRTPFHNTYISGHLSPRLSGEVRLLKAFAKAQGFYGSDNKTLALSGYLCELMIIKFGSFLAFCEAASKWEHGRVEIDIESHRHPAMDFAGHPMIVIDPVDPKRNVGAVVSAANFARIVMSCREFLRAPSASFFERPPLKGSASRLMKILHARKTNPIVIVFRRPDYVEDIIWPQLRKTTKRLVAILHEYEFMVIGSDSWADGKKCVLFIESGDFDLPNVRIIQGPPVFAHKNAEEFRKKYGPSGRVWVEDNIWVAEVKRKFTKPEVKLKDSLSDPLDQLKEKGIASHIAEAVDRGFRVISGEKVADFAAREPEFAGFLIGYFGKSHV